MANIGAVRTNAREAFRRSLELKRLLDARRRLHPSDDYQPHEICLRSPKSPEDAIYDRRGKPSGQLQFHQADHTIRLMAPGNGWGGTTAMGIEVDAWARHTNRWQKTPAWPLRMIWFCPEYQQFDIIKEDLEEHCFGSSVKYSNRSRLGPTYYWPDGSWLCVGSYKKSWTQYQGIQIDLVAFDEVPPAALWREMRVRRRGRRRTRYICKATQTEGWNWMADDLYLDWLNYHADRGIDEEQAADLQMHPDVWIWPFGSVHDNPHVVDEDCWEKEEIAWPSRKERKVRLYGGFESFVGDPVFDEDGIDWLIGIQKDWNKWYGAPQDGFLVCHDGSSVFEVTPERLADPESKIVFTHTQDADGGRVTVWEGPHPQHKYVIGVDSALGVQSGDYDAASVWDITTDPVRQVGEIAGKYGETWDRVIYAAVRYWNFAFIFAERQYGLWMLRSLLETYKHGWVYYERDYTSRGKRLRDSLGYPKTANRAREPLLTRMRQRVTQGTAMIRSLRTLDEMSKLKFIGPEGLEPSELTDQKLDIRLSTGGSPDLTMATMYALQATLEVVHFPEPPKPIYQRGSLGDILGHDALSRPERSRRSRRGAKRR